MNSRADLYETLYKIVAKCNLLGSTCCSNSFIVVSIFSLIELYNVVLRLVSLCLTVQCGIIIGCRMRLV